ncbi:leucine-rich repeat, immunoglobulin-like domain and transmembrane domain-containing protein 3 [Dermacentor andersoni]|uniref:leucine-rich repeat, immunoglobulin-like domain and transmembrane domain-containing protein 3 n=1 Tax=Dermacentor andersoni TaxID=34620 RepID=UPI003B3B280A
MPRTVSRASFSPSALVLSLIIMAAAAGAGGTASPHGGSCPSACSCKWSGGKRTAECAGLMGSVPQHLPSDTQVLNLTGNILKTLPGGHFQQARLVHLQRIYLSRCGIVLMADDAFRGLNNLVELDLSHNFLTAVPKLAPYCPLLRRLQLSANPIQRLAGHSFRGLHSLVSLELSQCQLAWLETNVFADLQSLEVLRLDGNRLRSLPPDGLTLPPLHSLDLSDNPWHCDCSLRSLRQWMHQRNVPLSVPPRCEGPPRLARRLWSQLEPDDFACAPRIAASELRVGAVEGENATLQCDIDSLPAANVRWLWRSRAIVNLSLISFGRQMYLLRAHQSGRRQQTSTLTIINVMLKDSGRYLCAAANRAGNQTANVTLIVRPRSADLAALSAPEIVGIVLGLLLLLALVAASACLLAVRRPARGPRAAKETQMRLESLLLESKQRSSDAGSLQANSEEQSGSPAPLLSSNKKPAPATAKSGIVAAVLRGEYRTLRACRGANKEEDGGASDVVTDALRVSAGAPRHEQVCATRKRPAGIVANPLSPGARDSPDEGLGDEREYETDILD